MIVIYSPLKTLLSLELLKTQNLTITSWLVLLNAACTVVYTIFCKQYLHTGFFFLVDAWQKIKTLVTCQAWKHLGQQGWICPTHKHSVRKDLNMCSSAVCYFVNVVKMGLKKFSPKEWQDLGYENSGTCIYNILLVVLRVLDTVPIFAIDNTASHWWFSVHPPSPPPLPPPK